MSSNTKQSDSIPSVPGDARIDPEIPVSAKEAPLTGVEAAKDTSFASQVQGHAKYFAGKVFGNDKEVQQGAARLRGEEDSLPEGGKTQHAVPSQSTTASNSTQPNQSKGNTAPPLAGGECSSAAAAGTAAGSQHGQQQRHQQGGIPVGVSPVSSSTGAGTGSGVGSARHTADHGATSGADKPEQDTATFH